MFVGAVEIVPVPDAIGELGELGDLFPGVPEADWEPYRRLYPELSSDSRWRLPVTVHVLRTGGTNILVDTGVGPAGLWDYWRPEREGLLPGALEALDIAREDVDVVFLTHLHVDHLGWNTDEDGAVFFPRARYLVHPDALDFARAKPDRPHIRRCVEALGGRFEPALDGAELGPGVMARLLSGHYPGHMGVSIRSEGASAELIGDIAPHPALLERPEWVFVFDDVEQTATRSRLIEEVCDTDCVVVCGHFPGSGIGWVVTSDDGVVWEEIGAE
jgi:glyoxylase-like metal-dependent hydrolase (beta-lactamase superfamily II)